ncbi:isochorismatase family protein [Pandoraea fibrosis]|uniref:Isochorismatase family protein n=1 Tax=Pandoraea fibrosis TaxID=1891094 RepID=A0ABX6HQP3_9BURK|nr:isochorismatase family protein [Pandoraea fibrosis]QHE93221.1 isochorismatase family protein [Pandoraea fibrosis]QHF13220.1 isochorismatase family protein [Pandoraea fibrosis]
MPLSQLDDMAALVVIDMQKGVVGLPLVHPVDAIVANNAKLAHAFRAWNLPVVLVNVAGVAPGRIDNAHRGPARRHDFAELVPELGEHPDDHTVTKLQWGAFHGTSLDTFLRRRGVTQLILTGIATSIGVESTARNAHDHGYHVGVVVDAMTDLDLAAHVHSVEKIFPRLGETTTTAEVLKQLSRRKPVG